nr:hypothetical protein CFP56_09151 [Quercus suber]
MIAYEWRYPKVIIALFCIEFLMTIACLTLYGLADPNTYRTKLWQNGSDLGFNSNPNEILYAYANYKPIDPPMSCPVQHCHLGAFDVRPAMQVYNVGHACLDPSPQRCRAYGARGALFCEPPLPVYPGSERSRTPTAGLALVLEQGLQVCNIWKLRILILFSVYLILSVWSMFLTPAEKKAREVDYRTDIEMKKYINYGADANLSKEEKWEKNRQLFMNLPKTPNSPGFGLRNPMTPRTVAFTALNGGPSTNTTTGKLPFREHYAPDGR